MYGILRVAADGVAQRLCFASKEDAQRFKDFANIYMDDSGAGNGYGAYWVYTNEKIRPSLWVPADSISQLRMDLVDSTLRRILSARTAVEMPIVNVQVEVNSQASAITFKVGELPPRLRPQKGDMFRIPRSLGTNQIPEMDGRVIEDLGDELSVITCFDEDRTGQIMPDKKPFIIKTSQAMKIEDYLRKIRGYP